MTYYEYIKSLPKSEMTMLFLYMCVNPEMLKSGFQTRNYRQPALLFRFYVTENIDPQNIKVGIFFSQKYEGKEVYQHFKEMTLEELSGVLRLIGVSYRARGDVLFGDRPIHILQAKRRPNKEIMKWLGREIRE